MFPVQLDSDQYLFMMPTFNNCSYNKCFLVYMLLFSESYSSNIVCIFLLISDYNSLWTNCNFWLQKQFNCLFCARCSSAHMSEETLARC